MAASYFIIYLFFSSLLSLILFFMFFFRIFTVLFLEKLLSLSRAVRLWSSRYVPEGSLYELRLEVIGAFAVSDIARRAKDRVKRSFGTLSLLQEIGHLFEFGSLSTFQKSRVYFVQVLGKMNSFLKCNVTKMFVSIEEEI